MLKKLSKALDITENIMVVIAALLLIISVLTVAIEIIARFLADTSFVWVIELNEYILLYLPFLVAAWLLRTNGHITLDLIDGLSNKLNYWLGIVVNLIGIFVCTIVTWYGTLSTIDFFVREVHSYSVLKIPQVYVVIIIPVGALVLTLEFIRKLYRDASKQKKMKAASNMTNDHLSA